MRTKSPPLLGYSHHYNEGDGESSSSSLSSQPYRDMGHDNVAFYGNGVGSSSYHQNIKQHYQQYSTFSNSTKEKQQHQHQPQPITVKYATYGATLIPVATATTTPNMPKPSHTQSSLSPSNSPISSMPQHCIACMNNRHQHLATATSTSAPTTVVNHQKPSSVLVSLAWRVR